MEQLSKDQKAKLVSYLGQFEARLKKELSAEGWRKERTERQKWFRKAFSKRGLKHLSEKEFSKIIKSLWASNVWSEKGKDYLTRKIIKDNGLVKIRKVLKDLFYGKGDLEERYESFKRSIKGIGDSSLTEILAFMDPEKYCIWNDKPKAILPILGLGEILPRRVFKYSIRGNDYVKCLELMNEIRIEMESFGFKPADFLDVDILMWLLFSEIDVKEVTKKEMPAQKIREEKVVLPKESDLDHWDSVALVSKLGLLLGFEVFVANPGYRSKAFDVSLGTLGKSTKELPEELRGIKGIERVDVLWVPFSGAYEKIYLFEIEDRGTMREALHRLYQALLLDAKMFVVGPRKNREKFEKWAQTEPFNSLTFRRKCKYKNFEELIGLYQQAKEFFELKKEFLGE